MTASPQTRRLAGPGMWPLAIVLVAGCGLGPATPATVQSASPTVVESTARPATPLPAPPTERAAPSAELLGSPPIARLAAEGGDPVDGQLGTYTWATGGSDSPWLRGAPITVAAGEPLTVSFEPLLGVEGWRARLVPAAAEGPAGARLLGEGGGVPRFEAPEPGAWTVALEVTFAAGLGTATYAWAVTVQ